MAQVRPSPAKRTKAAVKADWLAPTGPAAEPVDGNTSDPPAAFMPHAATDRVSATNPELRSQAAGQVGSPLLTLV